MVCVLNRDKCEEVGQKSSRDRGPTFGDLPSPSNSVFHHIPPLYPSHRKVIITPRSTLIRKAAKSVGHPRRQVLKSRQRIVGQDAESLRAPVHGVASFSAHSQRLIILSTSLPNSSPLKAPTADVEHTT